MKQSGLIFLSPRIRDYLKQHRRLIAYGVAALVITDLLGILPPWLVKKAIDAIPSLNDPFKLLPYVAAMVLVVAFQALFRFGWRRSLFGVSRHVEYQLRNSLFAHLQKQDRSFFLRRPIGELMSRATNDLVAIQEFIAFFGMVLVDSALTIGTCLVLMVIIDPVLAAVSMIPLPLLSVAFLYFGKKVRSKSAEVQEGLAEITRIVQESLAGIRLIKAYTLEGARHRIYSEATERYIGKNIELSSIRGLFYATLSFLAGATAVLVLWIGGLRVAGGHMSLGDFVAFNTYLTMLLWPMMSVGFMVNLFQRGRASMERIEEILEERPAIEEPPRPVRLAAPKGEIRFHEVSFRYPGANRNALKGITVAFAAGERVAVTGPVGCGKTTLLELMVRIFDPTEGSVLLDGHDIRTIGLKDLRRTVALVPQEPFLFSDSIAENIRLRAPKSRMADVERFARLARLDRDEECFPKGLDTLVGERGVMLSGGQRQRIALARAMISQPKILLLDDAFAHLDEETESVVLDNLLGSLPGSTLIFVSHRISALQRADRIIVMRDGRLVEEGPPELLLQSSRYFMKIRRHIQGGIESTKALRGKTL